MSELEIIIGIYAAIVSAAMLYFFYAVIKIERGGTIKKLTIEEVKSKEEKLKVIVTEETIALTKVKGIGPKLSEKLKNAGIEDAKELAASNPKEIAEALGVSEERASAFIKTARSLLRRRTEKQRLK